MISSELGFSDSFPSQTEDACPVCQWLGRVWPLKHHLVSPSPPGFTLDHSSRCSNICILIWSCSQLFLYRFDSRQDCWENILSWIEKLRYVCWQCGENVFSFQWKKLNSADDCWKVKEYQLKWKGLFLNICLFYAGPVVHSIVLGSWRCINFDFSSYEF